MNMGSPSSLIVDNHRPPTATTKSTAEVDSHRATDVTDVADAAVTSRPRSPDDVDEIVGWLHRPDTAGDGAARCVRRASGATLPRLSEPRL